MQHLARKKGEAAQARGCGSPRLIAGGYGVETYALTGNGKAFPGRMLTLSPANNFVFSAGSFKMTISG
jgi:hypothetical protein